MKKNAQIANAHCRIGCVIDRAEDYGIGEVNWAALEYGGGRHKRWMKRRSMYRLVKAAAERGAASGGGQTVGTVAFFYLCI